MLQNKPSQSRLTPCQLPRRGSFLLQSQKHFLSIEESLYGTESTAPIRE